MNSFKTKISLLLSAVLLFSLFTGCAKQKDENLEPVRLNEVVHSVFYAPQYVAQELGFFKDEGLDVTVTIGQGADKSMTALLSNSADIALLGTEAGIYVCNEGKEGYPKAFAQLRYPFYTTKDMNLAIKVSKKSFRKSLLEEVSL